MVVISTHPQARACHEACHEEEKNQFPQRALSQMYGCACEVGIGDAAAPWPRGVELRLRRKCGNWEHKHIWKSYKQNDMSQNMQYFCICERTKLDEFCR